MSEFADKLGAVVKARLGRQMTGLRRLSGGAIQELFRLELADGEPIILRRAPGGNQLASAVGLETEAEVMTLAGETGAPVPKILHVLRPEDDLGHGFLMTFSEGEGLGNRIVKDPALATPDLARQCGEAIALVHKADITRVPAHLARQTPAEVVAQWKTSYANTAWPRPVFAMTFKWLEAHCPPPPRVPRLVHGDFRNGNILIKPGAISALLDWELVHIGDPMEDLGWICVNSWRFGVVDKPVGGFGQREELWAGYEAASGETVNREHALFWEVLGTLRWGVMCAGMSASLAGEPPIDRAVIARRASETEVDLMRLIAPLGGR